MRKTFTFNQDRKLKPNYGNPTPVTRIAKNPSNAEKSYEQALTNKRKLDTQRHIKARQKYINELGEEAGKKAFHDSIKNYKFGGNGCMEWGETRYNELIRDMKRILSEMK